jgi:Na+/H+-dicarboxylate symporter
VPRVTDAAAEPLRPKGPFRFWFGIKLWIRILAGLVLGAAVGLWWGEDVVQIKWIGDVFVRLIRMMVAPLIFVIIASGVASLGDTRRLGSIGLKTFLFYVFNLTLAVAVGLAFATLFQPGVGANLAGATPLVTTPPKPPSELFIGIIPTNPIKALADGDTLAIIFFAGFLGAGVLAAGEKGRPLARGLASASEVMLTLVRAIMEVAPFGVFALIAVVMGTVGPAAFVNVAQLALCVLCGAAVQTLIVHGSIVRFLAWLPVVRFFRGILDAMMLGFSTASSSATLPVAIHVAEKNLGIRPAIAQTVLPLGATIGMDGTGMYMAMLTLFCAQAFGVQLDPQDYALLLGTTVLVAMGAAPVPSGSLFVLSAVTAVVGLTPEQTALVVGFILPFDRILDMMRTVPNVTSDLAAAATLARWEKEIDMSVYNAKPVE